MCLFAALALVRLMEVMPAALALLCAAAIMLALAFAIERLVLRPLVNQDGDHPVHGDDRHHVFSSPVLASRCSAARSTRSISASRKTR